MHNYINTHKPRELGPTSYHTTHLRRMFIHSPDPHPPQSLPHLLRQGSSCFGALGVAYSLVPYLDSQTLPQSQLLSPNRQLPHAHIALYTYDSIHRERAAAHLRLTPLVGDDWSSLVNHNSFLHVFKGGIHGNNIVVGQLGLLIVACVCVGEYIITMK